MLPTLLMLPGTLCDERIFKRQQLAMRGKVRIVCASYSRMKNRSRWLAKLLASLPQRFYVAGFSLGGLMALELLRTAPERIEGLALIASNAQPASLLSKRKSARLRKLWLDRGAAEVAKQVKPAYFHHEAKRRQHQQLVFDMALGTPRRSAFEEFEWAAKRPSSLNELARFGGRLLAISGAQDRLCPPAWQRAMIQAQPSMQWIELARCGHFLPLEAPCALTHALEHWIFNEKRFKPL